MLRRPLVALVALGVSWTVVSASAVAADPAAPTPAPTSTSSTPPLPEPWMRPGEVAPQAYQGSPQTQSPVASAPQRRTLGPGVRTAAVVADSAWSWYMDPRVLGTRTATYLSSVRKNGDIQVTKVARGSAELSHTVLAARFQADDHNAPSLTELPDGRIAAFWTAHSSVPARYRITKRPGDLSSFGPTLRLTGSGLESAPSTYTTMLQVEGAAYRYHLFTRRTSDNAWVMTRSKDLASWTPAVRLFAHEGREDPPYPKFVTAGDGTIHIAVSDTMASPGQRSSMYHLTLRDEVFRQSDGTPIRTLAEVAGSAGQAPRPIDPREATLVYDGRSADGRARVYDIAVSGGVPTIVLTTGAEDGTWTYKWFRHLAGTWTMRTLDRAGGAQPSGITLRHDDADRVFLSRGEGDVGSRELYEYRTGDDGASWQARAVTHGSTKGNRTPAAPWGAQDGSVSTAWLAGPYTSFSSGQWATTVSIETTDPAPLELRSTWPIGWSKGKGIDGRITAGVGGVGVPGQRAWIVARLPGGEERRRNSALTDADGSVHLAVNRYYPKGTRVRVEVPAAGGWGRASTASVDTATDTTAIDLDSTWLPGWDRGLGVGASVTQVRDGAPRVGAKVWVLARFPGGTEQRRNSAVTDTQGSVHLGINRYYPKGTRIRLQVPAQSGWGSATSESHWTGS